MNYLNNYDILIIPEYEHENILVKRAFRYRLFNMLC